MGWAHGSDLGLGRRPKLHGMQGVGPRRLRALMGAVGYDPSNQLRPTGGRMAAKACSRRARPENPLQPGPPQRPGDRHQQGLQEQGKRDQRHRVGQAQRPQTPKSTTRPTSIRLFGSTPASALPCPAGRSVPGRGGPERRRRPRPDGTGTPECSRDCPGDAPRHPGMSEHRMGRRCSVRPA